MWLVFQQTAARLSLIQFQFEFHQQSVYCLAAANIDNYRPSARTMQKQLADTGLVEFSSGRIFWVVVLVKWLAVSAHDQEVMRSIPATS